MNPGSISAPDEPPNPQPQESATEGLDGTVGNAVSVVMVTYHTGPVLFEAIEAVLSQDGLYEFILVDNGNPPEVVAQIERRTAENDRLIWLSGHGNIGFAAGCNLGAKSARGEYLLLLNPDSILAPGGLRNLLAEGIGRPRPWMLGGRLMNPEGTE